jgi:serine/threonine kinase 16
MSNIYGVGNIMIADDGITPVLMDFGSLVRARKHITSRQEAIHLQDIAAEHSTMPYRAPELFDVKTNSTITEKTDVWSLGCTLFALLYGHSPFEPATESSLAGDSIALAVTQGTFRFPGTGEYVDWGAKEVVRKCLVVDPEMRPSVSEVRVIVEDIITRMENEG